MNAQAALIAVTGATGFVGRAVVAHLSKAVDCSLRVAVRGPYEHFPDQVDVVHVASLSPSTNWGSFVAAANVVIHSAARVHILNDSASDPAEEYYRTNVVSTLNLAEQAAAAGVKRFIFISSIKVNGEATDKGAPFQADQQACPSDPYGVSKKEAEDGLREIASRTGMEVVIIRPVLVYGPGVKANFLNMMRWVDKGVPLPLGAISNKRSFVALRNLTDLIALCVHHPAAANQTFLVSDGKDLSTTELLRTMAGALKRPSRLIPVPMWILEALAAVIGKKPVAQRLAGSLQVDISKTRDLLGWKPPISVEDAMKETAHYYLEHQKNA